MPDFNFTVRATDNKGAFADRAFTITVKNTKVERFVAITNRNAYTSQDGINWTYRQGLGGQYIVYGGGVWIITQSDTNYLVSNDGIVWEPRVYPTSLWRQNYASMDNYFMYEPSFTNGKFMIVGIDGTIRTSVDGKTWDVWLAGAFIAGQTAGANYPSKIEYHPATDSYFVIHRPQYYQCLGNPGSLMTTVMTTFNATTKAKTVITLPATGVFLDIKYVNDVLLMSDCYRRYPYYSYNGITWNVASMDTTFPNGATVSNLDSGTRVRYLGPWRFCYGNGILLMSTFTEYMSGPYPDKVYRSVDGGRTYNMYSLPGQTASLAGNVSFSGTASSNYNWYTYGSIPAFSLGRFVMVGGTPQGNGSPRYGFAYSDDGITWSPGTPSYWEGVSSEYFRDCAGRLD